MITLHIDTSDMGAITCNSGTQKQNSEIWLSGLRANAETAAGLANQQKMKVYDYSNTCVSIEDTIVSRVAGLWEEEEDNEASFVCHLHPKDALALERSYGTFIRYETDEKDVPHMRLSGLFPVKVTAKSAVPKGEALLYKDGSLVAKIKLPVRIGK